MKQLPLLCVVMLGLTISACAPQSAATPAGTSTPEADGSTVIPADMTALPTSAEAVATLPAPPREDFVAADLTIEPWAGLQQRIAAAFGAGEAWADDPEQIAMEFSMNPPPIAETIQKSDTHAVMLITEIIAEDDSLAEQQILLELSRASEAEAWVVEFIGLRWKCREGRGQQEFAPELCV